MRSTDRLRSLILGILLLHIVGQESIAAPSYTIQDLGVDDAIKAAGPNISGKAAIRSGFGHAVSFVATPSAIAAVTLDSVGVLAAGDNTTANGINDAGVVVGSANTSTAVRPVIWSKGDLLVDLGTLPGDNAGEAYGINNNGAVVGYSSGSQGARAFMWTPKDGIQPLRPLIAGESSKAFGISDNGLIVGNSGSPMGTHAVLWNAGAIQDLGTLPGDTSSEAYAVNNSGIVVGYSSGLTGVRAFVWTSQTGMQALATLPGGKGSRAFAINDTGDIVGMSGSFDGPRAVIWSRQGGVVDLNALVTTPVGMTMGQALGINAKGQILVLSRNEMDAHAHHEGFDRVFLLTPAGP